MKRNCNITVPGQARPGQARPEAWAVTVGWWEARAKKRGPLVVTEMLNNIEGGKIERQLFLLLLFVVAVGINVRVRVRCRA